MVRTHGLTHIALAVRDAERSFRFYEEVFGTVAVYRQPGFIQAQTPGSWDVLVFEEKRTRRGQSGGIAHFGFRLVNPRDIDAAGEPYAFVTDPDGYEVEIWYERPTPVDPKAPRGR